MKKLTFISIALSAMIALQLNAQVSFNIKVYLEGPFNGTEMNTDLNVAGLIPLAQPYNVTPWNYTGTEQVTSIPNADIVDWVLIELRETTGDASTATPDKMIHRQAAFLKKGGEVVGLDGSSLISWSGSITSNLYLIIWHRNHLAIMSSSALANVGGIYSWDFTDQLSKAYLDGQKDIGGGKFGMIGGDCDASGRVFPKDKFVEWDEDTGWFDYFNSDLNLDCQIHNLDKDDIWLLNVGLIAKIPGDLVWECSMDFTDTRDGQIYSSVQIDNQCWMAENLNIGTMVPGSNNQINNSIIEKYCYDNNPANCDSYGGLYQWSEMQQYSNLPGVQGICPEGWHLPSHPEWCTLLQYVDYTIDCGTLGTYNGTNAGIRLKSASGWNGSGNGINSFGYNVLPAGIRWINGSFYHTGNYTDFWISLYGEYNYSLRGEFGYDYSNTYMVFDNISAGFSVRCLKDE